MQPRALHILSARSLSAFTRLSRRIGLRGGARLASQVAGRLLPGDLLVESTIKPGIRLELEISDRLQRLVLMTGEYEWDEIRFVRDHLPPEGVFIDVGAHVGIHSLAAARVLDGRGVVHAFEPYPPNVRRMRRNIELNPGSNIILNERALSDRAELVEISSRFPVSGNATMGPRPDAAGRAQVQAIRLDDYAREQGLQRIDVIKMDVEGAEMKALAGMKETLCSLRPPAILCEVNPVALRALGTSTEAVVGFLGGLGYVARHLRTGAVLGSQATLSPSGGHENIAFLR